MGRTIPLFIARAASILLAGMLLFALFGHARAENYDGYGLKAPDAAPSASDYGLKPIPGDNSGPVNAGYPSAPVSPAASTYGYISPVNNGFAPVAQQSMPAPQPVAPAPVAAPYQPAAASSTPYGYRPGEGMDDYSAAQPAMPYYPAQPMAAPQANGYYQTLNGQQPQQMAYQPSANARLNPNYVLGQGDKIKLTVFGETDLSGEFTIDGSGYIALPLIGQLRAAGYTAPQLEQTIGSSLARGYLKSPRISVEVSTYRPFYIIGAVNRPGEYPYVNHMNALNAIALAGGYQNNAVESVVFIRREGSNTEQEMPTDRTTAIYPGDVVRVHFTFLNDALSIFSPLTGAAGIGIAAATVH